MWQYLAKILVTAVVAVAVAELAKRGSFWGAILASLPLTSLLAIMWLYLDTGDRAAVSNLSRSIVWMVLPSLVFFLALPMLLRTTLPFWSSLGLACLATVVAYGGTIWIHHRATGSP